MRFRRDIRSFRSSITAQSSWTQVHRGTSRQRTQAMPADLDSRLAWSFWASAWRDPRGGASYGGCRKRCPSELTSRTFDRHSKQRKHRPRTLRKRLRFLVGRIGVKTNHYCWLAGRPRFTQLDVPTLTTSRVHATKLRVRKYSGTVTCNGLPDSRSRRNVLHPV
jgi:hypothetical protein